MFYTSSITHENLLGAVRRTTYIYTGSEALPAIQSLVDFKVKEPTVPKGFPAYQIEVSNTVSDSGGSKQQDVSFVSLTVPGKSTKFAGGSVEKIQKTHEWQKYAVSEYSSDMIDRSHYTSVPYLETVPFDGVQVKVYTNKNHYRNTCLFMVNGHLVSVDYSAGNDKLRLEPLKDQEAWKVIDSLVKGNSYLN